MKRVSKNIYIIHERLDAVRFSDEPGWWLIRYDEEGLERWCSTRSFPSVAKAVKAAESRGLAWKKM